MSIELWEGKGAHKQEVRPRLLVMQPAVVWHRPRGAKWDLQGRAESWRQQLWRGQAGRMGGDMWAEGKDKAPPGREGGLEEGRCGQQEGDEGQVWADMEEMRVHGGEEESSRKVKATGVGGGSRQERRAGEGRAPHLLRPRAMKD